VIKRTCKLDFVQVKKKPQINSNYMVIKNHAKRTGCLYARARLEHARQAGQVQEQVVHV